MGILYAVVPVRDAGDGDFSKSPRVRNLFLLGAPILVLFGSWEKTGINIDRTAAFSYYMAGMAPTILITFTVCCIAIYLDRRRIRRHRGAMMALAVRDVGTRCARSSGPHRPTPPPENQL
jgi:hypothetical protein